jgi:hypothetical protein
MVPAAGAAVLKTVPARLSGRLLKGKIGRLPHAVRQALNERLRDSQPSDEILPWLNSLPEARQVLARHFGNSPITEQNLSQWRHGGHACWLANEQTKADMAYMEGACRGIDPSKRDALTGQIALVVTARMAVELRKFHEMTEGPAKSEAWEKLVRSLVLLRRGEFYAEKMRVERAKLDSLQVAQKVEKAPECEQEYQEHYRKILGMGGPHWNNFEQRWEGEGAEEMTEKEEIKRMVVAEFLRRKEAKAKEEAGMQKEEAPVDDSAGSPPLARPSFSDDRSSDVATPELPACPEDPGHPQPPEVSLSEARCAAPPAQPQPNLLRDAKTPAPSRLVAFRHPRTGALRHRLTKKP